MGLLGRLLGKTPQNAETEPSPTRRISGPTLYPGGEPLEVVGESHRQDELWEIVGGRRPDPVRFATEAVLQPEPDNPFDPNAIRVLVADCLVGYLSREDAAAYRPGLSRLIADNPTEQVALEAHIVGGGPRDDGIGFLGVFLDHDPADFGLSSRPHLPIRPRGSHLRTGLSESIETDLEDDSYDLSWYDELSADDPTAIEQLRSKLDSERDPLDRHYMFCELEHRLYRCRDAFASALDEFDAVCGQHHGEMMLTIRLALLDKFGAIPVIEMYRQAAIRCQKAKRWPAAREWAERGIRVYGDEAARPEVVDDLHKRAALATAKIEARDRPKPRRQTAPAASTRAPEHPFAFETLVCASCGESFDRPRQRGRKPAYCPTCREVATPALSR